ncbi:MAG: GntR family transcriptional regulator [Actinophytocola sp.]|nr:GntR family transcriptional regulator [Actinophytocola sp.]
MALRRVDRRSVTDEVFDQLLADMIDGELAAGEPLPSERRLAEVLGVSRPAVREAIQRMTHAGLVQVRQGGGTVVKDYRQHAGLDLLPRLLSPSGQPDPKVVRSILEARLHVGPKIAMLAAERGGKRLANPLAAAVDALDAAAGDAVTQQQHALTFWDHVVDGADSIAFRLMFNGLRAAYEPAIGALTTAMAAEVTRVDNYRLLAAAIVAGDVDATRTAALDLLSPATSAMLTVLDRLEEL